MRTKIEKSQAIWVAVALCVALLGMLAWWSMQAPATLAGLSALETSTKTVSPSVVQPGAVVTYTITLHNSSALSEVVALVEDPLEARLTLVAGSVQTTTGVFTPDGGRGFVWSEVNLPAGGTATLTFRATVSASAAHGAVITNTAVISDGLETTWLRSAAVRVDAEAPRVLITLPVPGAVVTASAISVSGYAWDRVEDRPPFPDAPVLLDINNNGGGYYAVRWSGVTDANFYVLQEARNSDFSDAKQTTDCPAPVYNTRCDIMARTPGTYYYRVQAIGDEGNSRWSNTKSVVVTTVLRSAQLLSPTAEDDNLAGVWVQIGTSPWYEATGTTTWSRQLLLPEVDRTEYTLRAYSEDKVGLRSLTDTITFYVDRVAPVPAITNLTAGQAVGNAYTIQGTTPSDGSGLARVEVSVDGGTTWYLATGTTTWSYQWTGIQQNRPYTVTARSRDNVGNWSALSAPIVVENTLFRVFLPVIARRHPPAPYAPTLTLSDNDGYGKYTLSWAYNYPGDNYPPTSYRFQEATDPGFTNLLINEVRSSPQNLSSKDVGTYYYRVCGINAHGTGPWSNVIMVGVAQKGYHDNFSSVGTGWPHNKTYYRNDSVPVYQATYANNAYQVKVVLNTLGHNNRLMGLVVAPYPSGATAFSNRYEVSIDHYFAQASDQVVPPDGGKAGIIFGANSTFGTLYVFEWNFEGSCAISKYTRATHPFTVINFDNIEYVRGWGACPMQSGYNKTQRFRVLVNGNTTDFFIGTSHIGKFTISGLTSYSNIGLVTGSWDRTPVDSRFDDFKFVPLD